MSLLVNMGLSLPGTFSSGPTEEPSPTKSLQRTASWSLESGSDPKKNVMLSRKPCKTPSMWRSVHPLHFWNFLSLPFHSFSTICNSETSPPHFLNGWASDAAFLKRQESQVHTLSFQESHNLSNQEQEQRVNICQVCCPIGAWKLRSCLTWHLSPELPLQILFFCAAWHVQDIWCWSTPRSSQ